MPDHELVCDVERQGKGLTGSWCLFFFDSEKLATVVGRDSTVSFENKSQIIIRGWGDLAENQVRGIDI